MLIMLTLAEDMVPLIAYQPTLLNAILTNNVHPIGLTCFDIDCQPWNKSGEKIIVCPPTEYFVEAHKAYGWLEKTLSELKKYTNRTIIVRKNLNLVKKVFLSLNN